jgi:hypothetical protein
VLAARDCRIRSACPAWRRREPSDKSGVSVRHHIDGGVAWLTPGGIAERRRGLQNPSVNLGLCPRYLSNWTFSGQVAAELDIYLRNLQHLEAAGGHRGEAGVLALEGDRHGVGRPVAVLGQDQVGLALAR